MTFRPALLFMFALAFNGLSLSASAASQNYLCLKSGVFGLGCSTSVDLDRIQQNIDSGIYNDDNARVDSALETFEQRGLYKMVSDYGQSPESASLFTLGLGPTRDKIGPAIDRKLRDERVLNLMLNSAISDLITDYRDLRSFINSKNQQIVDLVVKSDSVNALQKAKQQKARAQTLLGQVKAKISEQVKTLGINVSEQTLSRLIESAGGHEEIKLLVVGANLVKVVQVLQDRAKAALGTSSDAAEKNGISESYLGTFALLTRVMSAAISAYVDRIDNDFIPNLKVIIAKSQAMVKNGLKEQSNMIIHQKIQELGAKYIQILTDRRAALVARQAQLKEKFDPLAESFATAEIAGNVIDVISMSEETNVNLEELLNTTALLGDGHEGNDLTLEALSQLENSLFGQMN